MRVGLFSVFDNGLYARDTSKKIKAVFKSKVQSTAQSQEVKKARKMLTQFEKRIAEPDKLFTRLYEDNVSAKISDERFTKMSVN